MDRIQEDQREQVEVNLSFVEGVTLDVARTIGKWVDAEPRDYEIWINGLNPLEENETYLRDLTVAEIGTHCLVAGILDTCEKKYPGPTIESSVLIELLKGLKDAAFNTALANFEESEEEMHFWGLRRWKGKAVWVKRPPKLAELPGVKVLNLGDIFPGR